jgi:hypothetical protein
MSFPRRLTALVIVLLLCLSAIPALAAQIEGDTWTSPTYHFSVSWAGTDWQPQADSTLTAVGPERLDRLHLVNAVSSLYFEGATRYQGDISACVAQEANLLGEESGVSNIRPYRDEEGQPLVASGPNAQAAAFTLTLNVSGNELDLVEYVECRVLIPGQAVLVITLVTPPDSFKSQMAAAQPVIDSIKLGEAAPVNPLAAYGGWTAAATQRPSVAGPASGQLAFGPDTLAVARAGVDAPDAYIRAEFANPADASAPWDIGLGFRDSGNDQQFRLVVDSEGNWFFKDALGPVIASGAVVDFDASAGGSNIVEVVAAGDKGYFAFNQRLVTELDLSSRPTGGDAFVGAGFFTEDATKAAAAPYKDFQIWSLAGIDLEQSVAPTVEVDEGNFSTAIDASTSQPPAAGPADGALAQTVGAAAVEPAGVDLEDFVAHAVFTNPSDAGTTPWDFGIAFREQENGDHYRLTIASDGTWEFQIGLQDDLASGTVPSLNFEQGALNTLELVVAGNSAGFSVNGEFISSLDTSQLHGASDVWIGAGFHRANASEGESTQFQDFTVWPLAAIPLVPSVVGTPVAGATPIAGAIPIGGATPVAAAGGEPVAFRLAEQNDSGIDALAVLQGSGNSTDVTVTARGMTGGEVVVIHDGVCAKEATLPAFLLQDLDASGHSETQIAAPLSDLTDGEHSVAIHRSAERYNDIVACGDIPPAG